MKKRILEAGNSHHVHEYSDLWGEATNVTPLAAWTEDSVSSREALGPYAGQTDWEAKGAWAQRAVT